MKRLACIAMILFIGGCAIQKTREQHAVVNDASQLHVWSAQGRMGISGVPQAGSGSFNWQQHDQVSQLSLHGPLGTGAVSLLLDDTLHITLSNGAHYDSDAALQEMELRLGTAVPVRQLSYWLRGLAAPGEYQWTDGKKTLQQDGWNIEYSDSMTVEALQLPRKITATHDAVRIRVVIEEWKLR
ncbi:MAG: lipoprotein insertase outer membrane protein LolB [Steroidobacter sp.]